MKTSKVYMYTTETSTVVMLKRPSTSGYKTLTRLIADDGKILVNGSKRAKRVDTMNPKQWTEIDGGKYVI